MRKNLIKLMSAMLVSTMLLAACNLGESNKTQTTTQAQSTDANTTTDSETTDEASESDSSTGDEGNGPGELIEFDLMFGEHASEPYQEDSWLIMPWALENYNVKLNMTAIPSSDYLTRISTTIAGGDVPDIMMGVSRDLANEYGVKGMFLNLWDYKDLMPNMLDAMEEFPLLKTWMYSDTEMYSQAATIATPGAVNMTAYYIQFIRDDILEEVGISEMPKSFEDLTEAFRAMKEAYPEAYPWINRSNFRMILNTFAPGLGINVAPMSTTNTFWAVWDEDSETFTHIMDEPNFKWFLEWMNGLFEEGLLDPNYAADDTTTWESKLVSSQGFFSVDYFARPDMMETGGKTTNENFSLKALLTPSLDDGEQKIYANVGIVGGNVFSAKNEHPERLAELLDGWYYSDEGILLQSYGIEGETFTINDDNTLSKIYPDEVKNALEFDSYFGANYLTFYAFKPDFIGYDLFDPEQSETYNETWLTYEDEQIDLPPIIIRNAEETEAYLEYSVDLEEVTLNVFHEFIMGRRDFSDWDQAKAEMDDAGMTRFIEELNAAYQRLYK